MSLRPQGRSLIYSSTCLLIYSHPLMRALYLALVVAALVWAAVNPHDYLTLLLETFPVLLGIPVLVLTRRRFPLTPLLYTLLFLHALILIVGGHYTYALVPAGDWVRDLVGGTRNNYDKLGHFAQGFVPAILAREVLSRRRVVNGRGWLAFVVGSIVLAFSALYELIEWAAAVALGSDAESFLGTQGYEWDTQSDMALALVGAVVALLLLARWHDQQMARLGSVRA
jgi:putative membrane protein